MINPGRALKHGLATLLPGVILTRGRRRDNRVALTFDDGPHPENTPRILDVLDDHRAMATFFVQAEIAEKYPALVREMSSRGHQIGNHGYSHLDAKQSCLRAYVADTQRAQLVLEDIVGRKLDPIFRPPFGNITGRAFLALAWRGFRFVFWSVDSRDSFIRDPSALTAHVTSQSIGGGDILLFHEDYAHTLASLPRILQSLQDRRLGFTLVENL